MLKPSRLLAPLLAAAGPVVRASRMTVREAIADVGAEKLKDTGKVMTELKSRYPGQIDCVKARRMICQRLG
jgi:uncharacterized protein YqeY